MNIIEKARKIKDLNSKEVNEDKNLRLIVLQRLYHEIVPLHGQHSRLGPISIETAGGYAYEIKMGQISISSIACELSSDKNFVYITITKASEPFKINRTSCDEDISKVVEYIANGVSYYI